MTRSASVSFARRAIVAGVAFALLPLRLGAQAQTQGKVYRIGWLSNIPPTTPAGKRLYELYEQRIRELGYIEGKNLFVERRYSEGRLERLPDMAEELVRLGVDVIVAAATPAVQAAQKATRKVPIVMVAVVDPEGAGLVASLARPGGNVTGLSMLSVELSAKRLELLKEVIPAVTRVAALWNPANRSNQLQLEHSRRVARTLGLALYAFEVRAVQDLEGAFQSAVQERAGGLVVFDDPTLFVHHARIVSHADRNRLAIVSGLAAFADAGALMTYGTDLRAHYGQAAVYVDKILKGAKPAELPVEQPTKFELVINMKTARALGIAIPAPVLLRADRVIE